MTMPTSLAENNGASSTSPLFYLWISSLLISTFYTLFWDLKMDWGLFDKNAGENRLLREQIVYDSKVRFPTIYFIISFGSKHF